MTDGWKDRVQTEYDELVEKISKLGVFLDFSDHGDATSVQVYLLYRQRRAMRSYADILKERLDT